jgi:hypothetical protein
MSGLDARVTEPGEVRHGCHTSEMFHGHLEPE